MTDLHIGFYMNHDSLEWHQFDPTPESSDFLEIDENGYNYMVVHFWNINTSSVHYSYTINVGNIGPTDYEAGMMKLNEYVKSILKP